MYAIAARDTSPTTQHFRADAQRRENTRLRADLASVTAGAVSDGRPWNGPRLWVWIGSPDDKLDVMRYVTATDKDVLNHPAVACLRADLARVTKERDEAQARADRANAILSAVPGWVLEAIVTAVRQGTGTDGIEENICKRIAKERSK